MNILLVIDGILFGGGARVYLQLAKGLANRGHNVFVACVPEGEVAPLLRNEGIEVLRVNFKSKNVFKIILQISKHIRAHSIDIVNSQGGRADFYARIAAKGQGVKGIISTVAMLVETYDIPLWKKVIYTGLDRLTETFVNHFVVVSSSLKRALPNVHRIPENKISIVHNGIELKEYHPEHSDRHCRTIRDEYKITDEQFLIGAIGRLVWQKGFEYLIRAVPDILKYNREVKILIVGDGPLHGKLNELASKLGISNHIIFSGFRRDIKELLSCIDLFVVPSILEGFPMVVLEAMAMAKPIVASQIDGITEQISDGAEGILIPPKNPESLAVAVLRLMNNKDLAARMGMSARQKAERCFSVEKMIIETEKVYLSPRPLL